MKTMRVGAIALTTALILGAGAGTSWAPRVKLLPAAGTACMVDLEKGTFVGTFGLQSFTVQNGVAMVVGSLVGTCSTDDADAEVPGGTIVAVPFKVPVASCDKIALELGDASITLGASKASVSIPGTTLVPDPKQVRGLFCAFAQKVSRQSPASLVDELNKIFARLS